MKHIIIIFFSCPPPEIFIFVDHFKVRAGNKTMVKNLSDAYKEFKQGDYFQGVVKERLVGTFTMLLAYITVASKNPFSYAFVIFSSSGILYFIISLINVLINA